MTKKIPMYLIIVAFFFVLFSCESKNNDEQIIKPKKDYSALTNKLDSVLTPIAKKAELSGIICIQQNEDTIYNKIFYTSPEIQTFNDDTQFMIGSLSKQFTATGILLLAKQGLIDLNENINQYIPNFPWGNVITIHDILTHTSGLPRDPFYEYMVEQFDDNFKKTYIDGIITNKRHQRFILSEYNYNAKTGMYTIKNTTTFSKKSQIMNMLFTTCYALDGLFADGYELIDTLLANNQIKIISTPGWKYNYSNLGYIILGYLIEKISGKKLEQFFVDEFFIPLQMYNTGFGYIPSVKYDNSADDEHQEIYESNFAYGISEYDNLITQRLNMQSWPGAAGGLHSTINDLQRWATFMCNDQIMSLSDKSLLWGEYCKIGISTYGYGMLKTVRKINGWNVTDINHNGYIMSYNSSLHIIPEFGIKIIILSNNIRGTYTQENWINLILSHLIEQKIEDDD